MILSVLDGLLRIVGLVRVTHVDHLNELVDLLDARANIMDRCIDLNTRLKGHMEDRINALERIIELSIESDDM